MTVRGGTPSGHADTFAELHGMAIAAGFASATAISAPPQTIIGRETGSRTNKAADPHR
jgi:hypothetical protein